MFRRLYDWVLRMAHHRHAIPAMAGVSFAESSFFPIPPDVMLVPMILARRDKAYLIATVCTVSSVLGGCLGYFIGYALLESVGQWLIALYHMQDKIADFQKLYGEYGTWLILLKGLTPIPYKLVTIASGIAHFPFALFVILSIVTRGARFFIIAALLKRFGEPVQAFIEKRLGLLGWLFLIALVGGFAVIALL